VEAGGSLLGRYRLRARLGAGGMAEVFRAWQELPGGLRRGVVIKKIRPERLRAPGEAARFREEARVSLGLNHPHIVQVYDYGEEDGQPYLVLEEVTGPSLAALGAALTRQRQLLPPDEALLLAADLAAALDHLHGVCDETGRPIGLVHRDLCASNVLLTRRAEAKLADFGVSRAAGVDQPVEGHLSTMAPEQLGGRAVGPAADLWALGVVLWELLTGQRLLGPEAPSGGRAPGSPAPDAAAWRARLDARLAAGPLPAPSSRRAALPDGVDALVGMLLDPEPRARPSASAAHAELLRLVGPPLLPRLRLAERIAALCPPLPEGEAAEGPPPSDEEAATVVAPAAAERSASTAPPAPAPALTHSHTAGSLHQPPRRAALPLAGGAAVLAVVLAVFAATRPGDRAAPRQDDAAAVILGQTSPAQGAVAPRTAEAPPAAPPSASAPPAPTPPTAPAPPAPPAAAPPAPPAAAPPAAPTPAPATASPAPSSSSAAPAAPPKPAPKPTPATATAAAVPAPAPPPAPPPAPAEAAPAMLSVRVEGDFAWFTIDGQRQRKPVKGLSLPLAPGRHTVEAELRTSGEVIRRVVELRGGETTSLQIEAPQ
jgi:serine/threonine protein kinase